jgi:hypothetical protein
MPSLLLSPRLRRFDHQPIRRPSIHKMHIDPAAVKGQAFARARSESGEHLGSDRLNLPLDRQKEAIDLLDKGGTAARAACIRFRPTALPG